MTAVFPQLQGATYRRHALHEPSRAWPETNCHTDLFVEVLATLGREPAAGLGMTVAQDFEGDQFTFFKMATADLETLFGLDVQELSIYRPLADHLEQQLARGRLVLVEVDAMYLPDTRGITYGTEHSKTTIAVNRFDRATARLGYFHNAGYFDIAGADVEALIGFGAAAAPVLPAYCEFVKVAGPGLTGPALAEAALARFRGHWARRPRGNPLAAYRAALPEHLAWLATQPPCSFHPYAFNTSRQYGANIALLGTHLHWLGSELGLPTAAAEELCERLTGAAKTFQFLLARGLARRKLDALDAALATMASDHDALMAAIAQALPLGEAAEAPSLVPAAG
jgi:hypothetical protein